MSHVTSPTRSQVRKDINTKDRAAPLVLLQLLDGIAVCRAPRCEMPGA
jgi:hypothetical protein